MLSLKMPVNESEWIFNLRMMVKRFRNLRTCIPYVDTHEQ